MKLTKKKDPLYYSIGEKIRSKITGDHIAKLKDIPSSAKTFTTISGDSGTITRRSENGLMLYATFSNREVIYNPTGLWLKGRPGDDIAVLTS